MVNRRPRPTEPAPSRAHGELAQHLDPHPEAALVDVEGRLVLHLQVQVRGVTGRSVAAASVSYDGSRLAVALGRRLADVAVRLHACAGRAA